MEMEILNRSRLVSGGFDDAIAKVMNYFRFAWQRRVMRNEVKVLWILLKNEHCENRNLKSIETAFR